MKYKLRNDYQPLNVDTCLEEILTLRGVKVEDLEAFMLPSKEDELDPHLLDNIDEAADLYLWHLKKGGKICYIVDSDCDGYTSSAILWNYTKKQFPDANMRFTCHTHKQHGLEDKIDWLVDEEHFDLVVCADSASYDGEYMQRLQEVGTSVLVLDHHSLPDGYSMEKQTPPNVVVVNNQLSPNYTNKSLCGAGVVYKFCQILDEKLGISQADEYLDLVALGEIADVMDKRFIETNYLMAEGLRRIKNEGFKALLAAQDYSLKGKGVPPYHNLTTTDIAFYIAPLINAITRAGSMEEKRVMFYAFIEPNKLVQSSKRGAKEGDTEAAAEQNARVAGNVRNRQNKIKEKAIETIEFKIQKEGLDENNVIVVEVEPEDDIPQELSGLVAMAIVSKHNKPCLIVRRNSEGFLRGSGRNNENFQELPDLKKFCETSGFFEYAQGHANAHGTSIHFSKLQGFLNYANTVLSPTAFENSYLVDYVFDANDYLLPQVGMKIAAHPEYFGNGVEEVKIIVKNIPLSNIFVMGADKSSIKISCNGVSYVRFKDLDFVEAVQNNCGKTITAMGRLNLNEWQGKKSLQIFLNDYEFEENLTDKYDF